MQIDIAKKVFSPEPSEVAWARNVIHQICLLYTSDAADERSSADLGGRRIIKKKNGSSIVRHYNPLYHSQHTDN